MSDKSLLEDYTRWLKNNNAVDGNFDLVSEFLLSPHYFPTPNIKLADRACSCQGDHYGFVSDPYCAVHGKNEYTQ